MTIDKIDRDFWRAQAPQATEAEIGLLARMPWEQEVEEDGAVRLSFMNCEDFDEIFTAISRLSARISGEGPNTGPFIISLYQDRDDGYDEDCDGDSEDGSRVDGIICAYYVEP